MKEGWTIVAVDGAAYDHNSRAKIVQLATSDEMYTLEFTWNEDWWRQTSKHRALRAGWTDLREACDVQPCSYHVFADASARSDCLPVVARDLERRLPSVLKGLSGRSRVDMKGVRITHSSDSGEKSWQSISFADQIFMDGLRNHVADVEEVEDLEAHKISQHTEQPSCSIQ